MSSSLDHEGNYKFDMNCNSKNICHSVNSLPPYPPKSSLHDIGSRKPLSFSQAEALDNILTDGPYPLTGRNTCYESGYFSAESKLSLHTTAENLSNSDEIDKFDKEHLDLLLADIAEEFGGCWKALGRQLLRKECSIENINEDYSKVKEKSYQMLIQWKTEEGKTASIIQIFKSLIHIGKEDIAEKLLAYLPVVIARECEIILQSSPKKIRCASMTTPIHNIREQPKDLTVEKQLRIQDEEEVYVCSSKISKTKYLLKEIEDSLRAYKWAARVVIFDKQLVAKKKTLRKTNEFLKDLKLKEEKVTQLKEIVEKLQSKIHIKHMNFCEEEVKCHNCEKTSLMRDLIEKDLSLLHHELLSMCRGHRRLSISGIPTERIYNLASRVYDVSEEHKKFHTEFSKIKKFRRCSMELLDDDGDEVGKFDSIEDPVQCTLNILRHFGRKRQVVQSLTVKERKKMSRKVQRHSSDKSQTVRSRFYLPSTRNTLENQETLRPIWPTRIGSKIFSHKKRSSSEKKQKRKISEPQRQGRIKQDDYDLVSTRQQSRSNTFPLSLPNNKPLLFGPGLDDIDDLGSAFSSVRISNEQLTKNAQCCNTDADVSSTPLYDTGMFDPEEIPYTGMLLNGHISSSSSAPNLKDCQSHRQGVVQNSLYDTRSPNVFNTLSRKKYLERRQRSFSEDDVVEVTKMYQGGYTLQTSEPYLAATCNNGVLWNTEIDHETIFFV